MSELADYVGTPKCQDCGWKLDTGLTNNCSCRGHRADPEVFEMEFTLARYLQAKAREE